MFKNKEIKDAQGNFIHLERPEFDEPVLIRNRKVVNEEGYRIYLERIKQNKYVPTVEDKEKALEVQKTAESLLLEAEKKKNQELEDRLLRLEKLLENGNRN